MILNLKKISTLFILYSKLIIFNNLYLIGKNMFSNLKSAIQKVTSKATEEDEYKGEDVQAVIILLLEACQIDGETGQVELDYIKKLLVNKFGFNEKDANDNISKALEDSEQRIEIFSQIKDY
jgi:uncharacterized tellurite resistance protein B-like protein